MENDIEKTTLKIRTLVEVFLVPIIGFGVYLLQDITKNIQELNTKVAIILTEGNYNREKIKDIEIRLRDLEKGNK